MSDFRVPIILALAVLGIFSALAIDALHSWVIWLGLRRRNPERNWDSYVG